METQCRTKITDCRKFLSDELLAKKNRNSGYSLRAFAKMLGVSPAQLSKIMSGKRLPSQLQAIKIADKLALSPQEKMAFLTSINAKLLGSPSPDDQSSYEMLAEDKFKLISEWYHFAILGLANCTDNHASTKWIASKINVDGFVVAEAFSRLQRLGLVEVKKNGTFRQTTKPLTTTTDIPSSAIRRYHKQNLDLAKEKIEEVEVSLRDYSSITIAIDPKKLPAAKEMIAKFKKEIQEELGRGLKNEVYTVAIQMFPVTKLNGEKK